MTRKKPMQIYVLCLDMKKKMRSFNQSQYLDLYRANQNEHIITTKPYKFYLQTSNIDDNIIIDISKSVNALVDCLLAKNADILSWRSYICDKHLLSSCCCKCSKCISFNFVLSSSNFCCALYKLLWNLSTVFFSIDNIPSFDFVKKIIIHVISVYSLQVKCTQSESEKTK